MPLKGQKMTQSTKDKISASRKGITAWNKGKSWSNATIEKISNAKKGKTAWNKGLNWPNSTKKKISVSKSGKSTWNKGVSWPDEVKDKISNSKKGSIPWNKGRKWSDAIKKKIMRTQLSKILDVPSFYKRNQISDRLRVLVLHRDNSKCTSCGKTAQETVLEVHHIVPVSKGGENMLDNLTTHCVQCNRGKGNLTFDKRKT